MTTHTRTALLALGLLLLTPAAANAQGYGEEFINGGFGLGAGWANIDDADADILALAQYRGESWEVELDYLFGDDTVWALHGNYIYTAEREFDALDSGVYFGAGYTYVNYDFDGPAQAGVEDNDNGFNVLIGFDVDASWGIEARYALLDNNMLTITGTYNFGGLDDE